MSGELFNMPKAELDALRAEIRAEIEAAERKQERLRSLGAERIADERQHQLRVEGWTPEHDDQHERGELVDAARAYLIAPRFGGDPPTYWPWARSYWKPCPDDRVRELTKAGALIAAEIDRLLRVGAES